jgi:hypothetical protein
MIIANRMVIFGYPERKQIIFYRRIWNKDDFAREIRLYE